MFEPPAMAKIQIPSCISCAEGILWLLALRCLLGLLSSQLEGRTLVTPALGNYLAKEISITTYIFFLVIETD